jgi:CDP-diacylglycerol--glycerol-3-phosphate 3-phosphatidyltransferase
MVPAFVVLMSIEHLATYIIAYIIFTVASITDYYDGKIAREKNLITNFGKLMDPLADKVLMVSAFIMMMKVPDLNIPGWTLVAILAREFLVTGARSLAIEDGGQAIAANQWGKIKTVIQMVYVYTFLFFAIVALGLRYSDPEWLTTYLDVLNISSMVGIIFVSIFTVASGIQFAMTNWKSLALGSQS